LTSTFKNPRKSDYNKKASLFLVRLSVALEAEHFSKNLLEDLIRISRI
jgi:hypothetical protein